MDISLIVLIASGILGLIAYLLKADRETQMNRINILEREMDLRPTNSEVRQLLDDKILPLKEQMLDIKDRVEQVLDLMIKNNK